jgi:hypothetical protein
MIFSVNLHTFLSIQMKKEILIFFNMNSNLSDKCRCLTGIVITKFLSNASGPWSHSDCHIFFEEKCVFSVKCESFLQKPQLYISSVDIRRCHVETSYFILLLTESTVIHFLINFQ